MQISLAFVLAIVTLDNCKDPHAKSGGYLIDKKGQKKDSHRKSKANLTSHEVEPPRIDSSDFDSLDTVAAKEKWLLGMWEDAWNRLKVEAISKKSKEEAEVEPNSEEGRWMKEWEMLMEAILGTTSTNANEAEVEGERIPGEIKYRDEALNRIRFFIRPQFRRRSLKWTQSTKETDILFLAHLITNDLHETMYRVIYPDIPTGKPDGRLDGKSCNETFRCFMTTPTMTTMTTSLPVAPISLSKTSTISPQFDQLKPPNTTPPENKIETFLNTFLSDHLKRLFKPSKRKVLQREQSGDQADNDIECDPNERWKNFCGISNFVVW